VYIWLGSTQDWLNWTGDKHDVPFEKEGGKRGEGGLNPHAIP